MNVFTVTRCLLFSLLVVPMSTFAQSPAGVRLEAGIAKEDVDGDLKSAIDIYQKIADDNSAPRDVRSKALMRLAGCYEKLGRQARQVYERVVHDFADQPVASQARTRLASLERQEHPPAPATMTVRKMESSEQRHRLINDTDGQRVVYQDPSGSLFFGDEGGRARKLVFKGRPGDSPGWTPSKDFSMVSLTFYEKPNRPATVAVVRTDGTGYRELFHEEGAISNVAWSWDNRFELRVFTDTRNGGGRLVLVSIADGQRRDLQSTGIGHFSKAVFSPDGRYIAYELIPPIGQGPSRVFLMPFQGGEPRQVYEAAVRQSQSVPTFDKHTLLDWTADGRYLMISDSPLGKGGLYLLPVKNGAAAGDPAFVRYGEVWDGNTTASGALIFESVRPGGRFRVFDASFGSNGHLGPWRQMDLRGDNMTFIHEPSFSPDGTQVSYLADDHDSTGGAALVLRDLTTGKERILYRLNNSMPSCRFVTRFPKLVCTEVNNGNTSLVSVDAESGQVEQLGTIPGIRCVWRGGTSHDDRAIYLAKLDSSLPFASPQSMMKWDLASRQETLLAPGETAYEQFGASGDDQWLLRQTIKNLSVRPIAGGEWRSLASLNGWSAWAFTPDGRSVLYSNKDESGKNGLFQITTTGDEPRRLGDLPSYPLYLFLSPDGNQLILETAEFGENDMWVLENFLPSAKQ